MFDAESGFLGGGQAGYAAAGLASVVGAGALAAYAVAFQRKTRGLS